MSFLSHGIIINSIFVSPNPPAPPTMGKEFSSDELKNAVEPSDVVPRNFAECLADRINAALEWAAQCPELKAWKLREISGSVNALLDALQFTEQHGEVCPAGWQKGDEGMVNTPDGVDDAFAVAGIVA